MTIARLRLLKTKGDNGRKWACRRNKGETSQRAIGQKLVYPIKWLEREDAPWRYENFVINMAVIRTRNIVRTELDRGAPC